MGTVGVSRRSVIILAVLAVAHIMLAAWFASVTPYRTAGYELRFDPATGKQIEMKDIGAPDERQHTNYVRFVLEKGTLPTLDPKDPELYENYQGHQPPLYYLVAAGWSKLTGVSPTMETRDEGLRMRFLSSLFGVCALVGTFFLGRAARASESTALLAAGITALLPMNVALSGAMSNDPLIFALITWCLVMVTRGLTNGWTTKTIVLAGVFAGLAALTKTTGVALFSGLFIAAVVTKYSESGKSNWKGPWLALGLAILVAAPWWIRNMGIYGDPFAMSAFNQAFTGTMQASTMVDALGPFDYWTQMVGLYTLRSFIGTFGYMNVWLSSTGTVGGQMQIYTVSLVILGIGALAGLAKLRTNRAVALVLGLYTLVVVVLFIRFNMQYFQGQARYVFPALAPLSLLIAAGWMNLARQRKGIAVVAIAVALLLPLGMAFKNVPEGFERRLRPIVRS